MQPKKDERGNLQRPSELKRQQKTVPQPSKTSATDAEHEYNKAIKRLVQSKEYQILKSEAARLASENLTGMAKDVNSLIAYFTGTMLQTAFSLLFQRLEKIARDN